MPQQSLSLALNLSRSINELPLPPVTIAISPASPLSRSSGNPPKIHQYANLIALLSFSRRECHPQRPGTDDCHPRHLPMSHLSHPDTDSPRSVQPHLHSCTKSPSTSYLPARSRLEPTPTCTHVDAPSSTNPRRRCRIVMFRIPQNPTLTTRDLYGGVQTIVWIRRPHGYVYTAVKH